MPTDKKTVYNSEKIYPTKRQLIVFHQPFDVAVGTKSKEEKEKMKNKTISALTNAILEQRSLQRTKTMVHDIVLCNKFDMFCTFTFRDNRQNVDYCKARMQYWLQSQQKQYGSFSYLIVPEYHKDGESLHFHALFAGYNGRIQPRKYDDGNFAYTRAGKQMFDIISWRNGFANSTIIDTDGSIEKVANYITKYITKDMPKFHGKKRYWTSQDLVRPEKNTNVDTLPYLNADNVQVVENDLYTIYIVEKSAPVDPPEL